MFSGHGMCDEGIEVITAAEPLAFCMAPRSMENSGSRAVPPPVAGDRTRQQGEGTGEVKRRGRPHKKSFQDGGGSSSSARKGKDQASGGRGRGRGRGGGNAGGGGGDGGGGSGGGGGGGGGGGFGPYDVVFNSKSFMPRMLAINTGENVCEFVKYYCQGPPRGLCVVNACGAVSNVTLRQPDGTLKTYNGHLDILGLSGCLLPDLPEEYSPGEDLTYLGNLKLTLANVDGRAHGGVVQRWLIAAEPVTLVVGTFEIGDLIIRKARKNSESGSASTTNKPPTRSATPQPPMSPAPHPPAEPEQALAVPPPVPPGPLSIAEPLADDDVWEVCTDIWSKYDSGLLERFRK